MYSMYDKDFVDPIHNTARIFEAEINIEMKV